MRCRKESNTLKPKKKKKLCIEVKSKRKPYFSAKKRKKKKPFVRAITGAENIA